MKEALWGYLIVLLGVIVTVTMLLVSRVTTHAEEDYYLAREIMQAALLDSVDYGAYRTTGKIIISKNKFIEVYIRRFAESVTNSQNYQIDFYDIYEEPPKASVRIRTKSGEATVNQDSINFNVDTLITGILETNYEQYIATKDNNGDYLEGKSITVRYTINESNGIPKNSSVTLILSDNVSLGNESSNLDKSSCKYNSGSSCDVFYNGNQYRVSRNNLMVESPIISGDTFDNTEYKYCEYPELRNESTNTTNYVSKVVKKGGAKIYSNSSGSNPKNIAECTVVYVGACDYGPKGNMCKTKDGKYIYSSNLTTKCDNKIVDDDGVTLDDLKDLKDYDEIIKEIEKKKNMVIILDQNGVTTLGDPLVIYYNKSQNKIYKYDNDKQVQISKVTLPKNNKKTCSGYKTKKGVTIIDKNGKPVSNFGTLLEKEYGKSSNYYLIYPNC